MNYTYYMFLYMLFLIYYLIYFRLHISLGEIICDYFFNTLYGALENKRK